MAKARVHVAAVIERFVRALKEQGLNVERVILFGSQAQGRVKEHSDIDLLVVSPDFADIPLVKRFEVLGKAFAQVRQPIDALACTPDEVDIDKLSEASFLYDVLVRQETIEYRP